MLIGEIINLEISKKESYEKNERNQKKIKRNMARIQLRSEGKKS